MRCRHAILLPLLSLALACVQSIPLPRVPYRRPPLRTIYLENGLTVLAQPRPGCRAVVLDYSSRIGSTDDPIGREGLCALNGRLVLRHASEATTPTGGAWALSTGRNLTRLSLTVEPENIALGLQALADALSNTSFDSPLVDRERRALAIVQQRRHDRLTDRIDDLAFQTSFASGSLIAPSHGAPAALSNLTPQALREQFHAAFLPSESVLVVIGSFEFDRLRKALENAFTDEPREPDPTLRKRLPTRRARGVATRLPADVSQTYLTVTFPAPAAGDNQEAAMELAAAILGQGEQSRLSQRLRERERVASSVTARLASVWPSSLLIIQTTILPDRQADVREIIDQEVQRLTGGVKQSELARAKQLVRARVHRETASAQGHAGMLGSRHLLTGDAFPLADYLTAIDNVTADQVVSIAKTHLDPILVNEIALVPHDAASGPAK